jgi:hypothetical protein
MKSHVVYLLIHERPLEVGIRHFSIFLYLVYGNSFRK